MAFKIMAKGLKRLVSAASLALCLAGSNVNCGSEGMEVRGNYPKFNQEIKHALEMKVKDLVENDYRIVENAGNYMLAAVGTRPVISFGETPKELINYFVGFTQKEYKAKGISMPDLEGVNLSLLPMDEVKDICGEEFGACYHDIGNIITMPDTLDIQSFFSVFNHELGHHLYSGNDEYPAEANEAYSAMKAYQFSKVIGSFMIEDMLSYSHDKALSEVGRIDKRYDKARLFSPINLADYGGDIERAMEHIVNSEKSTIAKRLNEELSGYEGQTITEMGFGLWNRILDSGYLADSLIKLDGLHTVTPEDAAEFEDYSRILNFKVLSKLLMEQGGEEYYGLLEDFVLNGHFSNPYFRADSVSTLNRKLYPEMEDLFSRSQVDPEVLYALSKKIVDINSSYPCHVEDPYVCPKVVRNIVDSNHVKAHVSISFAALNSDSDRQREAEYYAINFLTKFYPGVDFVNGDLAALQNASNSITNNYVPFIMVNAGTTSYGYDDCLAEKFLNAALIAECTHSAEMPYFGLCKEEQDYASEYLDFIRYNGNCE